MPAPPCIVEAAHLGRRPFPGASRCARRARHAGIRGRATVASTSTHAAHRTVTCPGPPAPPSPAARLRAEPRRPAPPAGTGPPAAAPAARRRPGPAPASLSHTGVWCCLFTVVWLRFSSLAFLCTSPTTSHGTPILPPLPPASIQQHPSSFSLSSPLSLPRPDPPSLAMNANAWRTCSALPSSRPAVRRPATPVARRSTAPRLRPGSPPSAPRTKSVNTPPGTLNHSVRHPNAHRPVPAPKACLSSRFRPAPGSVSAPPFVVRCAPIAPSSSDARTAPPRAHQAAPRLRRSTCASRPQDSPPTCACAIPRYACRPPREDARCPVERSSQPTRDGSPYRPA